MLDGLIPSLRSTHPARLELDPLDPINRGLVGFWPLDEAGGGVVRDLSPLRRVGSLVNTPTRLATTAGRATKFVRASSQQAIARRVATPTSYTIAWWMWATAAPATAIISQPFVSDDTDTTYGFSYDHTAGFASGCFFHRDIGGGYNFCTAGPAELTGGVWHLVVATWDGANIRAYRDGVLITTTAMTTIYQSMGAVLAWGGVTPSAAYWDGQIRLGRQWQRALSYAEIRRLYREPLAGTIDPAAMLFHAIKATASGVTVALTGTAATAAVGTLGVSRTTAMSGVAGTSAVGTTSPQTAVAASGVAGTAAVGTASPVTALAATGVAGTGAVGTVAPSLAMALTGVEGLAVVGSVDVTGDKTVALTGVEASGQVGDVTALAGTVSGTLRRRGRYRVYRDVPVELAPAVDLAAGYVETEVERVVEDAMRRLRALSLKASVARRTALVQELNTQIVAAVARAAEADEEDAIAALL